MTIYPVNGTRLVITNQNWGPVTLPTLHGVLWSVYEVLTEVLGTYPDALIRVYSRTFKPRTTPHARPYCMSLSARHRYWSKYVYQFAHQLCGILIRSDRYADHRHKWLNESLCVVASFFTLHRLAEEWVTNPPKAVYKAVEFAPWHKNYAQNLEKTYALKPTESVQEWFREALASLETNQDRGELCCTVAVSLLPEFLSEPKMWQDCSLLNSWDPSENQSLAEYLDAWSQRIIASGAKPVVPAVIRETLGVQSSAQ